MNDNVNIIVNTTTPVFQSWFDACQNGCEAARKRDFPSLPLEKLVAEFGRRYVKIMQVQPDPQNPNAQPIRSSAWAFIDRTNGDVLKPATWRAPAKGARGNIFDAQNGLEFMTEYGPAYLRGPSCGTPFLQKTTV